MHEEVWSAEFSILAHPFSRFLPRNAMNLANFLAHYFSIYIIPFSVNKFKFTLMVIMHIEVNVIYPHLKSFLSFAVVWEVITLPAGREVQILYWWRARIRNLSVCCVVWSLIEISFQVCVTLVVSFAAVIGGLPDFDRMTGGKYLRGFVGCIHSLIIQDQSGAGLNFREKALYSVNALPCTR